MRCVHWFVLVLSSSLLCIAALVMSPLDANAASQHRVSQATPPTSSGFSNADSSVTITVTNLGVEPAQITVTVGSEITWINKTDHIIRISDQSLPQRTNPTIFLPLIVNRTGQLSASAQTETSSLFADLHWSSGDIVPGAQFTHLFDIEGHIEYYTNHLTDVVGVINVVASQARIEVSPGALLMTGKNESRILTAQVFDRDGNPIAESVTWRSSHPEQVSVDEEGRATALVETGSAYIYATSNGMQSQPVSVIVAQPASGAVLIYDEQVSELPQPVNPDVLPDLGVQYRMSLRNIDELPPVGAPILGNESAPIAGRVISAMAIGDNTEVIYELVPLTELFESLAFSETIEFDSAAALAPALELAQAARRNADGSIAMLFESDNIRIRSTGVGQTNFTVGPFECESPVALELTPSLIEIKFEQNLDPGFAIDIEAFQLKYLLMKLEGEFKVTMSGHLKLTAAVEFEITCRLQRIIAAIPIGGPLSAVILPVVPAGVGFDLKGNADLAELEIGYSGVAGAAMDFGIEYQAETGFSTFGDFNVLQEGSPVVDTPNLGTDFRLESSYYFYALTGLGISILPDIYVRKVTWNIIDTTGGPLLDISMSTPYAQATAHDYASKYSLDIRGKSGIGQDLENFVRFVTGPFALDLSEVIDFATESNLILDESPHGVLTSSKPESAPDQPVFLTVDLDPTDLFNPFIGYNVIEVLFSRLNNGQLEQLAAVRATPEQSRFNFTWTPTEADIGDNTFIAFVRSRWLPRFPLEVATDSRLTISVKPNEVVERSTSLISVSTSGRQAVSGSDFTGYPAISADGRYVAYESLAHNLVAGDTNNAIDIFLSDRQTAETTRISIASDGTQANVDSANPAISADGRFVAFSSSADNLVAGDTNQGIDIFVHDRQTGQTTRISIASNGAQGDGVAWAPAISADGRFVAFDSSADNLDASNAVNVTDVFVHDRQTGETTLISKATNGAPGNDWSSEPAISADGRYVAFRSDANNLVDNDTNGVRDVFLHDRQTGQTTRVSVAPNGLQSNGWSSEPAISADGLFVSFTSDASNLVAGDVAGSRDIFVYDRELGVINGISIIPNGAQANGWSTQSSLSTDGLLVAFFSHNNRLIPDDTNGVGDIFVHNRQTGLTIRTSVATGGAQANASSFDPAISADGRFVVFASDAENLVADDANGERDIFISDQGQD